MDVVYGQPHSCLLHRQTCVCHLDQILFRCMSLEGAIVVLSTVLYGFLCVPTKLAQATLPSYERIDTSDEGRDCSATRARIVVDYIFAMLRSVGRTLVRKRRQGLRAFVRGTRRS
jgi:hypothetical protein